MDNRIYLFLKSVGFDNSTIFPITGDASNRVYYRLNKQGATYILADSSKCKSSQIDFKKIRESLENANLNVPKLFFSDDNLGFMILEDFGKYTFAEQIKNDIEISFDDRYFRIMDFLKLLHQEGNLSAPLFDNKFFMYELSFFTKYYLPYINNKNSITVVEEFNRSWKKSLEYLHEYDMKKVFVHKDFHCGNIFWLPERKSVDQIGIIDFQSARLGSQAYDLTSILYDCRNDISDELRRNLYSYFLEGADFDNKKFKNVCDIFIAQRNIKILGNFAGIFLQRDDDSYLRYLPTVWKFIHIAFENPLLSDVKVWFEKNNMSAKSL